MSPTAPATRATQATRRGRPDSVHDEREHVRGESAASVGALRRRKPGRQSRRLPESQDHAARRADRDWPLLRQLRLVLQRAGRVSRWHARHDRLEHRAKRERVPVARGQDSHRDCGDEQQRVCARDRVGRTESQGAGGRLRARRDVRRLRARRQERPVQLVGRVGGDLPRPPEPGRPRLHQAARLRRLAGDDGAHRDFRLGRLHPQPRRSAGLDVHSRRHELPHAASRPHALERDQQAELRRRPQRKALLEGGVRGRHLEVGAQGHIPGPEASLRRSADDVLREHRRTSR